MWRMEADYRDDKLARKPFFFSCFLFLFNNTQAPHTKHVYLLGLQGPCNLQISMTFVFGGNNALVKTHKSGGQSLVIEVLNQ